MSAPCASASPPLHAHAPAFANASAEGARATATRPHTGCVLGATRSNVFAAGVATGGRRGEPASARARGRDTGEHGAHGARRRIVDARDAERGAARRPATAPRASAPRLVPIERVPRARRAVTRAVGADSGREGAAARRWSAREVRARGAPPAAAITHVRADARFTRRTAPLRQHRAEPRARIGAGASVLRELAGGLVSRVAFPAPPDVRAAIPPEMALGSSPTELLMCVRRTAPRGARGGERALDASDGVESVSARSRMTDSTNHTAESVAFAAVAASTPGGSSRYGAQTPVFARGHAPPGRRRPRPRASSHHQRRPARRRKASGASSWRTAPRRRQLEASGASRAARRRRRDVTEPPSETRPGAGIRSSAGRGHLAVAVRLATRSRSAREERRGGRRRGRGLRAAARKKLWAAAAIPGRLPRGAPTGRAHRTPRTAPFACGRCVARRAGDVVGDPCGIVRRRRARPPSWRSDVRATADAAMPARWRSYEAQPRIGSGRQDAISARRGNAPVSALDLARADIVLTTYETLRGDLHHAPDAAGVGRSARRAIAAAARCYGRRGGEYAINPAAHALDAVSQRAVLDSRPRRGGIVHGGGGGHGVDVPGVRSGGRRAIFFAASGVRQGLFAVSAALTRRR